MGDDLRTVARDEHEAITNRVNENINTIFPGNFCQQLYKGDIRDVFSAVRFNQESFTAV